MLYISSLFPCSGVRPFGVSLLVVGWDEDEQRPLLYQCDPSVSFILLHYNCFGILVRDGVFVTIPTIEVFERFHSSIFYFQGTSFPWKATALGRNSMNGKAFLEKRFVLLFCMYWNAKNRFFERLFGIA